jgi:hypothetical protein
MKHYASEVAALKPLMYDVTNPSSDDQIVSAIDELIEALGELKEWVGENIKPAPLTIAQIAEAYAFCDAADRRDCIAVFTTYDPPYNLPDPVGPAVRAICARFRGHAPMPSYYTAIADLRAALHAIELDRVAVTLYGGSIALGEAAGLLGVAHVRDDEYAGYYPRDVRNSVNWRLLDDAIQAGTLGDYEVGA